MNVLVLNAGSSSLRCAYFERGSSAELSKQPDWSAEVRWTQLPAHAKLHWTSASGSGAAAVDIDEHGGAARAVIASAMESFGIAPDIVGHRVVHGMSETHCTLIDARVRALIEAAAELAPLHNRATLAGIDAARAVFPAAAQAADFDTAFHTTLAPAVAAYAVPYDWFTTRGIRRFGFHGVSHRYCAGRTAELLKRDATGLRMVSAHLGNGCSLAAIVDGKSVDTTMGFTPLDGLVMGARCGSIDPGLLLHLIASKAYDAAELDTILNTASGLKGVSGVSEDIRAVIAAAAAGAPRSQVALDMYIHRLGSDIAAMAAAAGGLDALSFTGGVGEHSAYVRERTCARLAFLGVALEPATADAAGDRELSAPHSAVRVFAITAREEYAIARDVVRLLDRTPAAA